MPDTFLHGVQVIDVSDGARSITTVASSVIGLVGTAPNADPAVFPLNTPVLIAGSQSLAAKLSAMNTGSDYGTLPGAVQDIFDVTGAVVVVVRVDKGADDTQTMANIIGGVDTNGNYTGAHALLTANSLLGQKPRVLIAPGFTHQRTQNGVASLVISDAGAGYTDGTYDLVVTGGSGGAGATGTAVVSGGKVTSCTVTSPGSGYTVVPTFALPAIAGTGTTTATFTASIGTVGNAVVAELLPIANRLRAVVIQDGPNTKDADAIQAAGDFGDKRVYLVDPWVTKLDAISQANVTRPASASVAGLIAWVDNSLGFWWSPSNQTLNAVIALGRPIDFTLGDTSSGANLLNQANVATIIRQNGFRLWGNRTLSSDPKWTFLSVVRTADIINDSLQAAHLWAVDRGITKGYVDSVLEGVNSYLRYLTSLGAILGGKCWIDSDLNQSASIASGKIYFDFDFTPPFPAEDVTFRSHLVNDYVQTIF
jgi:uncharacterized protein